jgi:hypothetical protein
MLGVLTITNLREAGVVPARFEEHAEEHLVEGRAARFAALVMQMADTINALPVQSTVSIDIDEAERFEVRIQRASPAPAKITTQDTARPRLRMAALRSETTDVEGAVDRGKEQVVDGKAASLVALVVQVANTINALPAKSTFLVDVEEGERFGVRIQRANETPRRAGGQIGTRPRVGSAPSSPNSTDSLSSAAKKQTLPSANRGQRAS